MKISNRLPLKWCLSEAQGRCSATPQGPGEGGLQRPARPVVWAQETHRKPAEYFGKQGRNYRLRPLGTSEGVKTHGTCETRPSPQAGNRLIERPTRRYVPGKRKDGPDRTQSSWGTATSLRDSESRDAPGARPALRSCPLSPACRCTWAVTGQMTRLSPFACPQTNGSE